jgi:hypothetical protein
MVFHQRVSQLRHGAHCLVYFMYTFLLVASQQHFSAFDHVVV